MKKMGHFKILFGSIVAIFATIFIISCAKENSTGDKIFKGETVTRGTENLLDLLGTSCVPSTIVVPGICNDTTFVDTLLVTGHPMYPGCAFTLIFYRQECTSGPFTDVTIGDFQIVNHNCLQFSNDLINNFNQSIWSSYIIDFETGMWNSIREIIISENLTGDRFQCLAGVFFQINFIRASCYRYALVVTREDGIGVYNKLSCGSQCCERHTKVCRKPDGTLQLTQYDATNPFAINCSDPAFLTDPPLWLKGRVIEITPCGVSCPN